jgi:hypothetical protein
MGNKALWERVCKTDPDAVKPITGKQYKGNSPKPYWIVERLTEEFGPCGIGWGFTILSERMERLSPTDILHVAVVRLWYFLGDKRGEFEQIGQTKAVYEKSQGGLMVDEDAPKKSVTDALVKCASYLGFAGDIFSGRWDDSKYVAEMRREFAEAKDPEVAKAKKRREELDEIALTLIDMHKEGRDTDAIRIWYDPQTFAANVEDGNEERMYVWGQLRKESALRSAIKANNPNTPKPELKEAA